MADDWKAEYAAPAGTFWLCCACGKWNTNRVDVGDESCFLNAALFRGAEPKWDVDVEKATYRLTNELVEDPSHAAR